MAGNKESKGPLIAAYGHSKYSLEELDRRQEARVAFLKQFEQTALSALDRWGLPISEGFTNVVRTPAFILETGRGDVEARITGIRDFNSGEYQKLTLDLEYGPWKPPFVAPQKPFKPVSIGLLYTRDRELMEIINHDHWSDALGGDDSRTPKLKQLRQANTVMEYLVKQYEFHPPSQQLPLGLERDN